MPEIEKLRAAFLRETDPEKQKALGLAISDRVIEQGFYVPIGQYKAFGAYRKDRLEGWLPAPGRRWCGTSARSTTAALDAVIPNEAQGLS